MADWYLGTMGFSYKQWVGPFYPDGLNARHHLAYYAERFNGLEIDSTFYGTPAESAIHRWRTVTPQNFKICLKMPRQITQFGLVVGSPSGTDQYRGPGHLPAPIRSSAAATIPSRDGSGAA